jgi:hypothetical protein
VILSPKTSLQQAADLEDVPTRALYSAPFPATGAFPSARAHILIRAKLPGKGRRTGKFSLHISDPLTA